MSTLKVNTVQHNTSGFNNVVQFTDGAGTENGVLCRAWVNFDGSSGSGTGSSDMTIRAEFNVSSITDGGVGVYTINLTNSLPSANYVVAGCTNSTTAGGAQDLVLPLSSYTPVASSVQVLTTAGYQGSQNSYDGQRVNVAIFA